jgi:Protein of unknown function (DUF1360)
MKSVAQTPTETVDYAALSAIYGALLAGVARSARGREPIALAELVPLSAATFALSKLVVHEKVDSWLREPFVEERPDGRRPRGRRLRYAVGELMGCTRCVGAWSALGLTALRLRSPAAGRAATAVLAASAGNDFLQTAFTLLCERANAAREAPGTRPARAAAPARHAA